MPHTPAPRFARRLMLAGGLITSALSLAIGAAAPSASATGAHSLIQGSGSTWAANAVNQWISDVQPNGLQVVYTGNGSAQGRADFANDTVDFAVSDIGYQGVDPVTHLNDQSTRPYAYLPIVAGGTSFPYHLVVNGQQVTNLRLSGQTLADIFTNKITNWDSPAIQKDNNLAHPFPSLPIVPVVHSEGSGDSAQFSRWLATDYASIWTPFNNGNDHFNEYWPRAGAQVAENGSDSVINFVTSAAANGAIGYDEYSYALGAGYPVAKVLNKAGYYTLPDQYNVAVALTKAQINYDTKSPDYLLQNLDNVYVNPAPQTYPLSSYSYLIEPTSASDQKMTTSKRQTLADYLYYSICQGQKEMGPIGYSPLPVNLVQAGFKQIAQLHSADSGVNLTNENVTTCHNPTFVPGHPTENYLAQIAPKPAACDKEGAGPCTTDTTGHLGNPKNGKAPTTKSTPTSKSSSGPSSSTTNPTGSSPPTTSNGAVPPVTQGGGNDTSQLGTGGNLASSSTSTGTTVGANPTAVQSTLPREQGHGLQVVLAILAGLLFVAAIALPPFLLDRFGKRRPT